jgi:hypothetical protein
VGGAAVPPPSVIAATRAAGSTLCRVIVHLSIGW